MLNNSFVAKNRSGYRLQLIYIFFSIFVLLFILSSNFVYADDINVSDGNEDFAFNAFIRDNDVIDGTADWDGDDEPGNDSGPKNGIVRTFDTVTYPLKVTVNPKKTKTLRNIQLKITGKLHDGFKDGRAIGAFAVGNKTIMTDARNGDITFEQTYTMNSSGNAVMIPVTINVQGAKPDQEIYPDYIKVEVISIDGEKIDNVSVTFNKLKKIRVSAKVNIGVKGDVNFSYTSNRLPYKLFNKNVDENDRQELNVANFSIMAIPLENKKSVKGSTFPTGRVYFQLTTSGYVNYDNAGYLDRTLTAEELPDLFDIMDIGDNKNANKVGAENTFSRSLDYYDNRHAYGSIKEAYSKSSNTVRGVRDSGEYHVEQQEVFDKSKVINGYFENYAIGNTFPTKGANVYVGEDTYSVNQKAFSTQAFLFLNKNYFSYKNDYNKYEKNNNAAFVFKINIKGYEDDDGNFVDLNIEKTIVSYDRNEFGNGGWVIGRIKDYWGNEIGTPHPSWTIVPQGDEAVLGPQDIRYDTYYALTGRVLGGIKYIIKWNSDSFYLDKEFAKKNLNFAYNQGYADYYFNIHRNDKEHQKVYFGVQKNKNNYFSVLTSNRFDDYNWYTFDEWDKAIADGPISAFLIDIHADMKTIGSSGQSYSIWLHTKTKKIGSQNEQGTYNVVMSELEFYRDVERKNAYYMRTGYKNPTYYDDEGNITLLQNPVKGTISFDTLAILDAKSSVRSELDKSSYYISESPKVTIKSAVNFAPGLNNALQDTNMHIKSILDDTFMYKKNSAYYVKDDKKYYVEPKIKNLSDKQTELSWDYLISNKDTTIPDMHYELDINPFNVAGGIISTSKIKSVIESDIDHRNEALRSYTNDVTLLKIGQVGVSESIEQDFGGKNSDYTLHLRPFTTIEDEYGVKGLTHVPSNGDSYGSKFNGSTYLKYANIKSDKPLQLYVNQQYVDVKDPNQIDVTKDGWVPYWDAYVDGTLRKTKSIYFVIPDVLSNKDTPMIDLTFGTNGNDFHDIYYNEVIANSNTHYPVSPISNKVSYQIKAQLELALRKIQIYTDQAKNGLPVNVYLNKDVIEDMGKYLTFEVNLYRKDTNELMDSQRFNGSSELSVVKMKIPSSKLSKDDMHLYEARIEGYDQNRVYAVKDNDKVSTEGYTSAEKLIKSEDKDLNYKGVVMTEHEVGFDMVKYYETIHVPAKILPKAKTGYGYELPNYEVTYKNELGYTDDHVQKYIPELLVNEKLMDKTMNTQSKGTYKVVPLEEIQNLNSVDKDTGKLFKYQLPEVSVHKNDGLSYDKQEILKLSEDKQREYLDGGRKLYIPIWLKDLGKYDIHFGSEDKLGINQVQLDLKQNINVYAYMYEASRSESIANDEVMLKPEMQKTK